jgi:hypothetical protein
MTAATKTSPAGASNRSSKAQAPARASADNLTQPNGAKPPTRAARQAPAAQPSAAALASRWRWPGRPRARVGSRHFRVLRLLDQAGWEPAQVQREYQLKPVVVAPAVSRRQHHGSREDQVAYVLNARPGTPTAVIATVGSQHSPRTGLPRAIRQATKLDAPLAYATNGRTVVEHFIASGQTRQVDGLASPLRAWRSYLRLHHLRRPGAQMVSQPFDTSILSDSGQPTDLRYYQTAAVNRTLGALSQERGKVLLQLAAGTGTTLVAAALMAKFAGYRLQTRPGRPCGLLYVDDRPEAVRDSQTGGAVRRFAGATQADVTIGALGESFDQLDPAGVDLVIVNLAHGGQAADPATWTSILDRFPDAYQVGIVGVAAPQAQPVYQYFGRPVYRYTAEQARSDGYLPALPAGAPDPAEQGPDDFDFEAVFGVPGGAFPAGANACPAPGASGAASAQRAAGPPAPERMADQFNAAGARRAVPASAGARGSNRQVRRPQDPVRVAVQIRRSVEYANLAAGQDALAAELVSLLQLADRPGAVGRAAAERADQLAELEILAELEDQVGGEEAILRHIALLKQLLASS